MHKKAIILALLGAGVFYLLSQFIGASNILPVLLKADPLMIGVSILFQIILLMVWTFRWETVANYMKLKIPFRRLFPYLVFVNFGDLITPGPRFGSEPLVVYVMEKKEHADPDDTMASMLVERLYGLVTFNILAVAAVFMLFLFVPVSRWLLVLLVVSLAIALGLSAFIVYIFKTEKEGIKIATKIADRILIFAYHLRHSHRGWRHESLAEYEQRLNKAIKIFFHDVVSLSKNENLWGKGILLSFIFYFIFFIQTYFAFLAVGVKVPFYLIIIMMTLSELTGYLVLLPSAVGVTEVLMIAILSSYGIGIGPAAAGTLLARGIYYIFGIVSGYVSMLYVAEE